MQQNEIYNTTLRAKSTYTFWVFTLLFISVAALRFFYCIQLPVNTGDITRHIYYGLFVDHKGLYAAGKSLIELDPHLQKVAWSYLPYNYPIVTLLFFSIVAKLSPTIFFAKFVLTLIEALNSLLVYKYSKQHFLALIYWASPISIWWVSHEGQFEPLQSVFVISALCILQKRKHLAFILLALAVQVKLTAVLFLPYFLLQTRHEKPEILSQVFIAFAIGFLPTFFSMFHFPAISQILSTITILKYNPYYWNIFNYSMFGWNPIGLIIINQLSSYGILFFLFICIFKSGDIKNFIAPCGFILICKINNLCQFWYFILFMPFLLPIHDKRLRLRLFMITYFLDVRSLAQILCGPLWNIVGTYYQGLTPFLKLTI